MISRSRSAWSRPVIAPISMACVPNHTRWLLRRCSSAISTRMALTRAGIFSSRPSIFSTDRQNARLLDWAPR